MPGDSGVTWLMSTVRPGDKVKVIIFHFQTKGWGMRKRSCR